MKITIQHDDGQEEIIQDITDFYVAVRLHKLMTTPGNIATYVEQGRSWSRGTNIRELVKEVQQSLVELQDHLREHRHGGSS